MSAAVAVNVRLLVIFFQTKKRMPLLTFQFVCVMLWWRYPRDFHIEMVLKIFFFPSRLIWFQLIAQKLKAGIFILAGFHAARAKGEIFEVLPLLCFSVE